MARAGTPDLAALEQQERLLVLRADLIDRDLARFKDDERDVRQRLRQVRNAIAAARKAQPDG